MESSLTAQYLSSGGKFVHSVIPCKEIYLQHYFILIFRAFLSSPLFLGCITGESCNYSKYSV